MSTLAYPAEGFNKNLPATVRNSAALGERVPIGDVPARSGEKKQKIHSFSRKLAKEIQAKKLKLNPKAKHAAHECLVLKYLANRVHASKNIVNEKPWFYATIEELNLSFPYLGNTTVYDLVISLERLGYLEIGNFNRYKYDRTLWFHVPKQVRHVAEEDLIYFDVAVAEDVGVVAAVLQRNFDYWIGQYRAQKIPLEVHLSPAQLKEHLPFGKSTLKKGVKVLEGKYLRKLSDRAPVFGLLEKGRGSYPNDKSPYPNGQGSYPNGDGSYPNNYTYWKTDNKLLESSSKTKPAALVFVTSDDVSKANENKIHLLHRVIIPFAAEQDKEEMKHGEITSAGDEIYSSILSSAQMTLDTKQITSTRSEIFESDNDKANSSPASSTDSMTDEVDDGDSRWPKITSLAYLHRINQDIHPFYKNLLLSPKTHQAVLNLCAKTMTLVPQNISDELYEDQDGDKILETLLPYYHELLDQTRLDSSSDLFNLLYYGALETLVGAFLWPRKKKDSYNHGIPEFTSTTHEIYLVLWRRAENLRLEAIDEEFEQRREAFASRDQDKENDASLSPAEKTRIFRNALNARNEVGWITFEQKHATQLIQVNKVGLQRIQRLFELNPNLTPAKLLLIMDGCINEFISRPAPPKRCVRGVKWHARTGYRLDRFASYLSTIVKQLGVVSPVEVYLSDDQSDEDEVVLAA